jgi:putative ABC transport system permease protein
MLKNYFKTAWRNIFRNKTATLINLFGLSVALVAFIFIALWVQNELTFDSYHKDARDIYLVQMKFNTETESSPLTSLPVADAVNKDRGVAAVARMAWWAGTLHVNGRLFDEKGGIAVDSDWFKIFDYDVINGDIQSFNNHPYSLLFTQSKAKQLFGNTNPIGQIIKLDTTLYVVRAIVRDNPVNSSFQFDMLVPMAARMVHRQGDKNNWGNLSYRTFVKINPHADVSSITGNVTALSQEMSKQSDFSIGVQPLRELHFDTRSSDPVFRRGSRTAVYVFSILAALLLITASINYVNLSIAKANARTKEISIRKIIGGSRLQLFLQFLTESFLLCLASLFISVVIVLATLPLFNQVTETGFQLSFFSPLLWGILLGTLLSAILLSGVFPAITMSFFRPLNYLRGFSILKFRNTAIRKGLVVFQFVIGVVFIIGTIVIFLQMRLAQTSAAQYNRSQVVSIRLPIQVLLKLNFDPQKVSLFERTLKTELQKNSSIQTVAAGSNSIEGSMNSNGIQNWYWNGMDTSYKGPVYYMSIDPEANSIFHLQLQEGRWFKEGGADKRNFVLNETAVKEFGIREPAVRQLFARSGGDTGVIIGVIKDYNFSSLYNKVGAMVISGNDGAELQTELFARIPAGGIPRAMDAITATWKQFVPDAPLEYQFMDQAFDNLYKDDLKLTRLVILFSCISIAISALGLFGLAAFVAEQRTREIGIRKVLGASVAQITTMLSKDFVRLVMIAIVIASPVAYWAMDAWLQHFAYRIDISWWIFVAAGAVALLIAVATTSGQAIRAAIANPVDALRSE